MHKNTKTRDVERTLTTHTRAVLLLLRRLLVVCCVFRLVLLLRILGALSCIGTRVFCSVAGHSSRRSAGFENSGAHFSCLFGEKHFAIYGIAFRPSPVVRLCVYVRTLRMRLPLRTANATAIDAGSALTLD